MEIPESACCLIQINEWDANHREILLKHSGKADVVYTRWRNEDGKEFPFSPYSRDPHLYGANFVGTDVLFDEEFIQYFRYLLTVDSVHGALRELARIGCTFLAVDAVTYTRRN